MRVPVFLEVWEIPIEYVGLFVLLVLSFLIILVIKGNRK